MLICSNSHLGAAALSAPIILSQCAAHLLLLLSPRGTPHPCLSTVQILKYIRSAYPCWLRPHLVTWARNDLWRETLHRGCTVPLDFFLTGIVTSQMISCAFSDKSSLLQILRNSARRHSVLCYFLCQAWQLETWDCFLVAFVPRACCPFKDCPLTFSLSFSSVHSHLFWRSPGSTGLINLSLNLNWLMVYAWSSMAHPAPCVHH